MHTTDKGSHVLTCGGNIRDPVHQTAPWERREALLQGLYLQPSDDDNRQYSRNTNQERISSPGIAERVTLSDRHTMSPSSSITQLSSSSNISQSRARPEKLEMGAIRRASQVTGLPPALKPRPTKDTKHSPSIASRATNASLPSGFALINILLTPQISEPTNKVAETQNENSHNNKEKDNTISFTPDGGWETILGT